jgi:hypothetical protein
MVCKCRCHLTWESSKLSHHGQVIFWPLDLIKYTVLLYTLHTTFFPRPNLTTYSRICKIATHLLLVPPPANLKPIVFMFKFKLIFLEFNYHVHVQMFCFVNHNSIFSLSPKTGASYCSWKQGFESLKIYHKTKREEMKRITEKVRGLMLDWGFKLSD